MEANSLSMKRALDLLRSIEESSNYSLRDLGFIITVFRDNELDEDMHKLLNLILQKI